MMVAFIYKKTAFMKEIKLTQGYIAKVDDDDFEKLSKHKWYAVVSKTKNLKRVYAVRMVRLGVNKRETIRMHRDILGIRDNNIKTDHKDHDTLNNQKSNIRQCTSSQNSLNIPSKIGSTSKYVGVSYIGEIKRKQKWLAKIEIQGKCHWIGRFYSEHDAAIARDEYILKNNLEFPKLNILTR